MRQILCLHKVYKGKKKWFNHPRFSTRIRNIPNNNSPKLSYQSLRNLAVPSTLKSEIEVNIEIILGRSKRSKFSNLLCVCHFWGSTTGSSLVSVVGLLTPVPFIAHWWQLVCKTRICLQAVLGALKERLWWKEKIGDVVRRPGMLDHVTFRRKSEALRC